MTNTAAPARPSTDTPSPAATPTPAPSSPTTANGPRSCPSAAALASATGAGRNRAVDFYRALAMCVVAVGHWLGMVVVLDASGAVDGGNLLDVAPEYWWATWIGQVMPLFFFVGGFASAASLTAATRAGTRPADWVATRLHRMMAPTRPLAWFWLAVLAIGAVAGVGGLAVQAAWAAAIPLWFLANYVIDTTLAPYTFRWFHHRRAVLVAALVTLFAIGETANLLGIAVLPQINWVVGWLIFQMAGFAWHAGLWPTGRRLVLVAAGLWAAAVTAVAVGPWPATMLHHGDLDVSPTHPPSFGFLVFGFAYAATAAAGAPAIDRWLSRSRRAWTATIAANSVAMSVYLWHMTAAMAVTGVLLVVDAVPMVEPATAAWWWSKLPVLAANAVVLAVIVSQVARVERTALLGGARRWVASPVWLGLIAAVLSVAIKAWSAQSGVLVAGLVAAALGMAALGRGTAVDAAPAEQQVGEKIRG